jgi:hypothetical protein
MQENNTSGKIYLEDNPEFVGDDERFCKTLGINFKLYFKLFSSCFYCLDYL